MRKNKRYVLISFLLIFLLILSSISFRSFAITVPTYTEILFVGETKQLNAIPDWIDDTNVTADILYGSWNSSNKTVATVNSKGEVRALKPGETVISLYYVHGDIPYDATINVEVIESVKGLNLKESVKNLYMGESYELKYSYIPSTAYVEEIEWKSSDTNVAKVSSTGKVTAVGMGEATITATTKYSKHSSTCKIIVNSMVENLILSPESMTIGIGETKTITATIYPDNTILKTVTWISSDSTIAKVSGGKVTGLRDGEVYITATTKDGGIEKKCHITVVGEVPVEKIVIKEKEVSIFTGEQYELLYDIYPENATNKKVKITVSKPVDTKQDIITIDKDNIITGIRQGSSIITVESTEYKINDTAIINVFSSATGVVINKKTENMYVGEPNKKLTATVLPQTGVDRPVTWESSDKTIVTVDTKGNLKAIKAGKATITATSIDGGFKDSCEVTVNNMVTGVSFEISSFQLGIDSYYTPKYVITPSTAYEKGVTFSTKNTNIATVDTNGKVRGRNVGETELIVTTKDGALQAFCKISVVYNARGITIYDEKGVPISELPSELNTPTPKPTVSPTIKPTVKPTATFKVTPKATPKITTTPKVTVTPKITPTPKKTTTPKVTATTKKITPTPKTTATPKVTFKITPTITPKVTSNVSILPLKPRSPQDPILIMVDGEYIECDVEPFIEDGRTLVPVRAIFEALGAEVTWISEYRMVIGRKNNIEIVLKIDNVNAYVNGNLNVLDVPARIVNDRTFVPARFIAESLGINVDWDAPSRTVVITSY